MAITKMISEVFEEVKNLETDDDKIKTLQRYKKQAMIDILYLALSDVEFTFTRDTLPEYTPDNEPIPFNPLNMYKSYKTLRHFRKDFPRTSPMTTDNMKRVFYSQVSGLAKSEAELFCKVLCKDFDYFTIDIALEAYPELKSMIKRGNDRVSQLALQTAKQKAHLLAVEDEKKEKEEQELKAAEKSLRDKLEKDIEDKRKLLLEQEKHILAEKELKERQAQDKLDTAAAAAAEKLLSKEELAQKARDDDEAENKLAKDIKKKRKKSRKKPRKKKPTKKPVDLTPDVIEGLDNKDIIKENSPTPYLNGTDFNAPKYEEDK